MPAPNGNTNAEKWNRKEVLAMLAKIEAEAKKPSCAWLGTALVKCDLYKDVWAYWKEKFSDDEVVFRTIKKIDTIFEERLFAKALKNEANATIAIFGLKNNHGWKDKQEVDHTTNGESLNNLKIEIVNASKPITSEDDIKEDIG